MSQPTDKKSPNQHDISELADQVQDLANEKETLKKKVKALEDRVAGMDQVAYDYTLEKCTTHLRWGHDHEDISSQSDERILHSRRRGTGNQAENEPSNSGQRANENECEPGEILFLYTPQTDFAQHVRSEMASFPAHATTSNQNAGFSNQNAGFSSGALGPTASAQTTSTHATSALATNAQETSAQATPAQATSAQAMSTQSAFTQDECASLVYLVTPAPLSQSRLKFAQTIETQHVASGTKVKEQVETISGTGRVLTDTNVGAKVGAQNASGNDERSMREPMNEESEGDEVIDTCHEDVEEDIITCECFEFMKESTKWKDNVTSLLELLVMQAYGEKYHPDLINELLDSTKREKAIAKVVANLKNDSNKNIQQIPARGVNIQDNCLANESPLTTEASKGTRNKNERKPRQQCVKDPPLNGNQSRQESPSKEQISPVKNKVVKCAYTGKIDIVCPAGSRPVIHIPPPKNSPSKPTTTCSIEKQGDMFKVVCCSAMKPCQKHK